MLDNFLLILAVSLGLVFLLSSAGKASDFETFVRGLADFRILPNRIVKACGLGIVVLEACLGITHVLGIGMVLALPIAVCLLFVFLMGISSARKRGLEINCSCFWRGSAQFISKTTLARVWLLIIGESILLIQQIIVSQPARLADFSLLDGLLAIFSSIVLLVLSSQVFKAVKLATRGRRTKQVQLS